MTEIPNPYLELRHGSKVVGRVEVPAGGEVVAGRTGQCPVVVNHEGTCYGVSVTSDGKKVYMGGGGSTLTIYDALLNPTHPKSFNDLLASISSIHLAVVFGEHDNTFQP